MYFVTGQYDLKLTQESACDSKLPSSIKEKAMCIIIVRKKSYVHLSYRFIANKIYSLTG